MKSVPLKTFIIYSREDERYKNHFLRHLKPLAFSGLLNIWHDGNIQPGEEWESEIKKNLEKSDLVLVLVSVNSLNSDFIQTKEISMALEQFKLGVTRLVPIVVSPCLWSYHPVFRGLQGLPQNMKPVSTWENLDEAWTEVVKKVAELIETKIETVATNKTETLGPLIPLRTSKMPPTRQKKTKEKTEEPTNETETDESHQNWKFRDLKLYSSTEWLAENQKQYRQVFYGPDIDYVYAELSFYNKEFDVEDWEIIVELRCYAVRKQRKEICILPFKRKVSKFDPICYIREGWGNKTKGVFWKTGAYMWEAWIDGKKVASKSFYVEESKTLFTVDENPFFTIKNLAIYEGPYDDVPESERTYNETLNSQDIRYIYTEISIENKMPEKDWQGELIIKFFNSARELKGQVIRLQKFEKENKNLKITAGWGSNVRGSWRAGVYNVGVIFLNQVVGSTSFKLE